MSRRSKRLTIAISIVVSLIVGAFLGAARYMSPTAWKRIATSPPTLVTTLVAYRQVWRLTSGLDQRKPWNYEIALDAAPPGEIHVIYVPRLFVNENLKDPTYPSVRIRRSPGVEIHVILDDRTFEVVHSYIHD